MKIEARDGVWILDPFKVMAIKRTTDWHGSIVYMDNGLQIVIDKINVENMWIMVLDERRSLITLNAVKHP